MTFRKADKPRVMVLERKVIRRIFGHDTRLILKNGDF